MEEETEKMSPPVNANANVDQKVLQYENFINEVLRRDLQRAMQESGSQRLKTDVDLGCNFYVQADVEDSSRIFVAVGYGFFVEMTYDEALRFIEKKTKQLTKDSAKIKANICMVLEGLRELQGLTDLPENRGRDVF
ncbi:hypothetical protein INR49_018218 [Caranx melampygus]|nr:hypothetical protein INR49_018218 [Caranx melampygus]